MFFFIYWLLHLALSSHIDLTRIPSSNPPPKARLYQAMDYDSSTNSLLVFGGSSTAANKYNDVWQFNLDTSLWSHLEETSSSAPDERIYSASFTDENSGIFYVFGGSSDYGPQNDLWGFTISTMKWKEITTTGDIPTPRGAMGCTKYTDSYGNLNFVIFGGKGLNGLLASMASLNVTTMAWTKLPKNGDYPFAMYSPQIKYYDGYIYLAGGDDYINGIYNTNFYRYDLASKKWENITDESATYTTRALGGSFIYNNSFYLTFGWSDVAQVDVSEVYKVDLTDPNFAWSVAEIVGTSDDPANIPRDSYGFAVNGNTFYICGGYYSGGNLNDVVKFDLTKTPIIYTSLAYINLSPSARAYHTMETIEGYIYIFGGAYKDTKLNDLWKFDPETETWESLSPNGVIPSARSHHASGSQGNVMFIFGGIDSSGQYLDDLYQFDVSSSTWKLISPSSDTLPSARYAACAVYSIPVLYIYGGQTSTYISNELWTYDSGSNTFTLISSDAPYKLFFPRCAMDTSATTLYIMGGKGDGDMPASNIFSYSVNTAEWKTLKIPADWFRNMGEGIVVYVRDYIIFIAGEQWGTDIKDYAYAIDMTNNYTYIDYPSTPVHIFAAAFTYYKTDIYIHGGGLATGIFMRNSVPVDTFYKVKLTQFCDSSSCPAICSPGTKKVSSGCSACPVGTYNSEFGQSSCDECPEGTYNPSSSCNNRRECFPCREGEYNDLTGQSLCKKCPFYYYCPTGSSSPSESSTEISSSSSQPKTYSTGTNEVSTLTDNYLIACLALFGIMTIFVLSSRPTRNWLKRIDMFEENHNVGDDIVLRKFKNRFGGYFTIGYLIGASWFIMANISSFVLDNVTESKALLPLVAVEDQATNFYGDIVLIASFIRYGGKCVADGACLSTIKVTTTNIESNGYTVKCVMDDNNDCVITFNCLDCEILTGAQVNFALSESLSFSSAIIVNVTSTSSIPGGISSEEIGLSSSTNKVLRGYDPTVFYFSMVPSLFQSSVSDWKNNLTGYHVEITQNPTRGSEYYAYELPFSSNQNLQVQLIKSTNCLNTIRSANQTWLILLSALLGAVFGWKGTVEGIMSSAEEKLSDVNEKISQKIEFSSRIRKIKHLLHVFDSRKTKKFEPIYNSLEFDELALGSKTLDKVSPRE
ncbi:unnamed protein product [Blepharisma stoltei]|uniref:Tyrosine-protein kinase ephrin type A/B receptor-like domain-containing protein n=1 Tax=Blepharisma stoltei TaxID=1481888 RepID=A0AAU9J076_9CILI|nr:unnamed protein product [Blepharisma stoltei]